MKLVNFLSCLLLLAGGCEVCTAQNVATDSLKKMLTVASNDTSKVNTYNKIADHFKTSNTDSTAIYAKLAANLAIKVNYKLGVANSFINQGNADLILGNYKSALQRFSNAATIFQKLAIDHSDDLSIKNGLARSFASSGIVYVEQSNYFMALEMYQKALNIYQSTNSKTNVSKLFNNIAIVYKSQLNYPKALEFLKKAFKIQTEIGEQNAAITLTNIGSVYFETGKYPEAIKYYNKARELFVKSQNIKGSALLSNYLGDYYKKQNNLSLAKKYYSESLLLYESLQNKFGASLALYNIAQLLADQNEYSEALPFVVQSLTYAKEIKVPDQTFHSEKLLSEIYESLGKPDSALIHYKNYVVARDSISNQETNKKFAIAEMNSEYAKKEAILKEENKRRFQFIIFMICGALLLAGLLLVIYNRMQIRKRLTLQKEVAEYEQKALHLQMNPHFVFNCLGAISSFIVQNGTDSALKYLSKFSKLMRLTLEYSKGSLIPIDKEIESLQNYLELEQLRFHHKFDFKITSGEKVEFNMGLPPLLIQPFVENAILHGIVPKEGEGIIAVDFDVIDQTLVCTITDNGIGMTESKILKENSVTAHKSMALEITRKRLEIMESTTQKLANIEIIELENNNHKTGTKVILKLPIQYIP